MTEAAIKLHHAFAAIDQKRGIYCPEFPPPNGETYCGECGKIAPTSADNDLCASCARAALEGKQ